MIRNGPTIGVWWKCMSISDQIGLQYVVALNGHLKSGPTIGVWWDQIGHLQ